MRKYDLTINNNDYEVTVKEVSDTEARVEVNGQEHIVKINDIQRLVLPETVPTKAPEPPPSIARPTTGPVAVSPQAGGVIAPMPGQIKAILVREGDKVTAGQKLVVMEAMKLENKIPATHDGVVKHILVRDGDIVSQGQELVIIS
jgi:biotin carboxyl carrier protein